MTSPLGDWFKGSVTGKMIWTVTVELNAARPNQRPYIQPGHVTNQNDQHRKSRIIQQLNVDLPWQIP